MACKREKSVETVNGEVLEKCWIARKREKSGNPVNEEELDGP
ncbi:hypothetical protein [Neobacillus mesonae]|nr:hypothetical protein [Neobacillus mesonae]